MKACGLAPSVADEALPQLAEVVYAVERALEAGDPGAPGRAARGGECPRASAPAPEGARRSPEVGGGRVAARSGLWLAGGSVGEHGAGAGRRRRRPRDGGLGDRPARRAGLRDGALSTGFGQMPGVLSRLPGTLSDPGRRLAGARPGSPAGPGGLLPVAAAVLGCLAAAGLVAARLAPEGTVVFARRSRGSGGPLGLDARPRARSVEALDPGG